MSETITPLTSIHPRTDEDQARFTTREKMHVIIEKTLRRKVSSDGLDEMLDEFTRVDSNSGELITSGWIVFWEYFGVKAEAEEYCQKIFGGSIEEIYEDESEDVYFTDWFEPDYPEHCLNLN